MNHDDLRHDPAPDPQLQAALRSLEGEPPVEQVDWEALRRRITERAELPLARRRRTNRQAHRWLRPFLPAAAAAGLVLAVFFSMRGPGETPALPAGDEPRPESVVTVEEALRADLSDQEFVLLVSGLEDSDELLRLAVETP